MHHFDAEAKAICSWMSYVAVTAYQTAYHVEMKSVYKSLFSKASFKLSEMRMGIWGCELRH
jgi:hypothetical protein